MTPATDIRHINYNSTVASGHKRLFYLSVILSKIFGLRVLISFKPFSCTSPCDNQCNLKSFSWFFSQNSDLSKLIFFYRNFYSFIPLCMVQNKHSQDIMHFRRVFSAAGDFTLRYFYNLTFKYIEFSHSKIT